jgi:hypothetical protein
VTWKWYITAEAARQYMALAYTGDPLRDEHFDAAEDALGQLSLTASQADTPPTASGGIIYRGWTVINGRRERLELTVMPDPRPEGELPQLVRVRLKRR